MKRYLPVVCRDRSQKARMIDAILRDFLGGPVAGYRTLDIGCGNGDISEAFAGANRHHAVDIKDQRRSTASGFEFRLVSSERLPYDDGCFDVVISHHVIEHVEDQRLHLAEIHRVLRTGGIAYLATPNRSSPLMKGHPGNERVLRFRQMLPLFAGQGFEVHEYGERVVREPDRFHGEVRVARFLPAFLVRRLRPLYPSQMFVLVKPPRKAATAGPALTW
jgi:ubiquinone/menaquinone biosynthesis C-methylase UbiE